MRDFANEGQANSAAFDLAVHQEIKSGVMPFDDSQYQGEEGVFTRMNMQQTVPRGAGQHWNKTGTTCYNPKNSDPRVEAVRGKAVYNPKANPESVNALNHRVKEQETIIAGLQQQMALLTAALQNAAAQPVKGVDELTYAEKRKLAKEKGLKVPRGTKEEELTEILTDAALQT